MDYGYRTIQLINEVKENRIREQQICNNHITMVLTPFICGETNDRLKGVLNKI